VYVVDSSCEWKPAGESVPMCVQAGEDVFAVWYRSRRSTPGSKIHTVASMLMVFPGESGVPSVVETTRRSIDSSWWNVSPALSEQELWSVLG
jgi:hypothetical protein